MATLVQDNFDRANNATVIGSPQVGPDPVVRSGVGGITANTVYGPTAPLIATYECGTVDVEISMTATLISGAASRGIGFIFGYADANNYWRMYWDSLNYIALSWWHGVWTTVVQLTRAPVNGDLLRASYKGGTFRAWTNNKQDFRYDIDSAPLPTATAHGFYFPHAQPRADNLLITDSTAIADYGPYAGATTLDLAGGNRVYRPGFVYRGRDTKALDAAGGS